MSIDDPIRISIDTHFAPLIDMCVLNMLTKLTRLVLDLLLARNLAQLECFQDDNEALAFIY